MAPFVLSPTGYTPSALEQLIRTTVPPFFTHNTELRLLVFDRLRCFGPITLVREVWIAIGYSATLQLTIVDHVHFVLVNAHQIFAHAHTQTETQDCFEHKYKSSIIYTDSLTIITPKVVVIFYHTLSTCWLHLWERQSNLHRRMQQSHTNGTGQYIIHSTLPALSCGFFRPANIILVPGIYFLGDNKYSKRVSSFHVMPLFLFAEV